MHSTRKVETASGRFRRRAPISRATECFSMYSDMSRRTIALSSSNWNSASALVSSVLPTPVGPRKMNRADRPMRVLQAVERGEVAEHADLGVCQHEMDRIGSGVHCDRSRRCRSVYDRRVGAADRPAFVGSTSTAPLITRLRRSMTAFFAPIGTVVGGHCLMVPYARRRPV
jgi:hypothetical protein